MALQHLIYFLLPILGLLKINLVGELYLHEAILILVLPVLLLRRKQPLNDRSTQLILLLITAWLASQMLSDWTHGTASDDFLRGWAKIAFFGASFLSLRFLIHDKAGVYYWMLGTGIAAMVRPFQLFELDRDPLVLWKFGFGFGLLTLFVTQTASSIQSKESFRPVYGRLAVILLAFGAISMLLNARSFAGICLLLAISTGVLARIPNREIRIPTLMAALAMTALVGAAIIQGYSTLASNGTLGQEAQEKYELQMASNAGILGILVGGRSEILVSIEAIEESPILGHGSWAKDFRYIERLLYLRQFFSNGEQSSGLELTANGGLIPTHSYLTGAWVEAGLMGGLFWFSIIAWALLKVLPSTLSSPSMVAYVALYQVPFLLWNILFSPFGATVRVDVAAVLAIFVLALRSETPSDEHEQNSRR